MPQQGSVSPGRPPEPIMPLTTTPQVVAKEPAVQPTIDQSPRPVPVPDPDTNWARK